ncbi:anthrone oxygenase family protein [uncultured Ferrovibrio sp.]|jgi:uncharacterized membrane protein|uniref:anthrone oxygenase family protein n=1 Tax=uncultured Ferrovibrio sp. TaxID=1576913 RepID=UPI002632322B|nr:anthrone oxygenase family protein [uncultured Ferrovibrio sp.]
MTEGLLSVLTLLAALGSGLIGGVFFAFSTFVMKALSRRPAAEAVAAMQSINIVVINPWFMAAFLGTAALCLLLAVLAFTQGPALALPRILAGAALYAVGTFGVTMVFNVPRNNRLARMQPASAEAAAYWPRYVAEWTGWNHLHTIAALAASAAFMLALFGID